MMTGVSLRVRASPKFSSLNPQLNHESYRAAPARMMEVMTGVSSRVRASPRTPPTERVRPSLANSLTNCSMAGLVRVRRSVKRCWFWVVKACASCQRIKERRDTLH